MKSLTLTEIIEIERKNKEFNFYFQKELIINQIAKIFVQLKKRTRFF